MAVVEVPIREAPVEGRFVPLVVEAVAGVVAVAAVLASVEAVVPSTTAQTGMGTTAQYVQYPSAAPYLSS